MLTPETFKCDRYCGKCCIDYFVLLSKNDVQRIKKLGHEESFFCEYVTVGPEKGKATLKKRSNKWCVFLNRDKEGVFSCGIYENRPDTCKKYPFFGRPIESCIPVKSLINIKR